jgi:hypothetical protein
MRNNARKTFAHPSKMEEDPALGPAAAEAETPAAEAGGYVYCMSNEGMPGIFKIGMTMDSPESRAKELSGATGVPYPFRVEISKRVHNPREKELAMHELLSVLGFRVNERREFFNCSRAIVEHLFALIDGTDVSVSNIQTSAITRNFAVNVVKLT